jgi:hypothetical protein
MPLVNVISVSYRYDGEGEHLMRVDEGTRTVERDRRLADCVNEVERRPVKDSIRADDDREEVACWSINLKPVAMRGYDFSFWLAAVLSLSTTVVCREASM